MSGGGDRPLLVLHDEEEGHLVYDLLLLDDDGEDVMTCLPCPVAQFVWLVHWCTRVWISLTHKDTFSLDLSDTAGGGGGSENNNLLLLHHYQWRKEGAWLLPFKGRALYVPEVHAVVGLSAETRRLCPCDNDIFLLTSTITVPAGLLCACDDDMFLLNTATTVPAAPPSVIRHLWRETYPAPWEECIIVDSHVSRPQDMPSLAYLGKGRFCICRTMSTMKPTDHGPTVKYDACSLLVVELKLPPNGDDCGGILLLAKRGRTTYMWSPQGRRSPYMGFIQPATELAR